MKLNEIAGFKSSTGDYLPPVLYHGTTLEKARNILRSGMDPGFSIDRGNDTDTAGYIFLAWNQRTAEQFAPGGEYSRLQEPGAILAVNLTDELARKIRTDLGEFIRCPVKISPRLINLVKITNNNDPVGSPDSPR